VCAVCVREGWEGTGLFRSFGRRRVLWGCVFDQVGLLLLVSLRDFAREKLIRAM
jgi:hypothetical protein